ncbi:MAG: response regulator, partial [Bacteroidota bacterium]|nr:response regulator [Bacteroidota bacterium]
MNDRDHVIPNWTDRRILIVEDTETSNLFFSHAFRQTGAELIWAESGDEAVELVSQDRDHVIDIVLMDINLPKLNGLLATSKIKQKRPNLPVIIQTAYTNVYDDEDAFAAGCDAFIVKPIRLS